MTLTTHTTDNATVQININAGESCLKINQNSASNVQMALLYDERIKDLNNGTTASRTWHQRALNTTQDPFELISDLTDNGFTLKEGHYLIEWRVPAMGVNMHVSRLRNLSSNEIAGNGSLENNILAKTVDLVLTNSTGKSFIQSNGTDKFAIEHFCEEHQATYGLGTVKNFFDAPYILSCVTITKLADIC